MRIIAQLIITLLFSIQSLKCGENNEKVAFVISPDKARQIKPDFIKSTIKNNFDIEVNILSPATLQDVEKLKNFGIIISNTSLINGKGITALKEYVSSGGSLVGLGNFGEWLDINDNGNIDPETDKRAAPETQQLTGCTIQAKNLSIVKMRSLSENSILRGFFISKWFDYPIYKPTASSLKITGNAMPLAEASFRPFSFKKAGFKYKYWDTRYTSRYGSYITANIIGSGVVLRISESLFKTPFNFLTKMLWKNLLDKSSYTLLTASNPAINNPEIIYIGGSMIPNPDFEESCTVSCPENLDTKNLQKGEFKMPAHWQFNSWNGGFYYGRLEKLKNDNGSYVLVIGADSPESRGGGANWRAINNQTNLLPGKSYKLSILAKGEKITSASLKLSVVNKQSEYSHFRKNLPAGSFDWQTFEHTFTLSATENKYGNLKRGFIAGINFTGPGKLYVDHFIFTEIEK
ncbi:MAG: carbohydrate binding domain-containing protein [Planctomycetota bacterium]|jgi:hypothetical protein